MSDVAPVGPLVDASWLARRLGAPDLVLVDASIAPHLAGDERIPGARRFDIDSRLSDPTTDLPHTLPADNALTDGLRAIGLDATDTVIAYDAAGIYSSARAWWMLRAAGHERVAVLDGGLPAWRAAGHRVEPAAASYDGPPGSIIARVDPTRFRSADDVVAALTDPDIAVLDARSRERYAGAAPEPRPGLRGGHLPGSVNLPFTEVQRDGLMRGSEELRGVLDALVGDRDRLVFSCGSGVTACVLALAAELAGREGLSVYDGSWSEWGRPSSYPVETGPGPSRLTSR